ncbi:NnrU family protein [Novosphingobium sp.]|uniref:NnrU family protein n=1 Tax=Novosphingobium sp. TaxID=1874826 RepID=UPI00286D3C40|nr:NnrU family protein [Novosphingobium sp.]
MDEQLTVLVAASLSFVGTHFALSHPLRGPLVARLGAGGFMALYSLVALATFAWMVLAFRAVPVGEVPWWNGTSDIAWGIASAIMLIASVLLAGSLRGNPAMPDPRAGELARHTPKGIFKVTRHPMMWSFALWSLAHVLVSPTMRVLVLSFAIAFLALIGAKLQDDKKMVLMGESWSIWEKHTSFLPRWQRLPQAGLVPWLGGTALWLGATWLHGALIGMAAGLWRWI